MGTKWHTIPGSTTFAYATQGGKRIGHVVLHMGFWSAWVTEPKLSNAGSHTTQAAARKGVSDFLARG